MPEATLVNAIRRSGRSLPLRQLPVRHGYRPASMAGIVTKAGLARATLYLHVAENQAGFRAVLAATERRMS